MIGLLELIGTLGTKRDERKGEEREDSKEGRILGPRKTRKDLE